MKKLIAILIVFFAYAYGTAHATCNNDCSWDPQRNETLCCLKRRVDNPCKQGRTFGNGERIFMDKYPRMKICKDNGGSEDWDWGGEADLVCSGFPKVNLAERPDLVAVPMNVANMKTACWGYKCADASMILEGTTCVAANDCRSQGGANIDGKCVKNDDGSPQLGTCKRGSEYLLVEDGVMGGRIGDANGVCTNCAIDEYPAQSGTGTSARYRCTAGKSADRELMRNCAAAPDFVTCIHDGGLRNNAWPTTTTPTNPTTPTVTPPSNPGGGGGGGSGGGGGVISPNPSRPPLREDATLQLVTY